MLHATRCAGDFVALSLFGAAALSALVVPARAATWLPDTLERQVRDAPVVVGGTVVAADVREEELPGYRPGKVIVTYFTIEVAEVLRVRGATAASRLTLLVPGGRLGQRSFADSSQPGIEVGDKLWLFLGPLRTDLYVLWAGAASAFAEAPAGSGKLIGPREWTVDALRGAVRAAEK